MDSATLIEQLEQPLNSAFSTPVIYKVKSGDTLSRIITQYYGIRYADPRYKMALASLLYFNDTVKDPNEIYPGQLLRLMPLYEDNATAFCPVPDDFYKEEHSPIITRHKLEPSGDYLPNFKHHMPHSPQELEAFWALSWLEENYGVAGSIALGAGFNTWGGLVSQSHNAFIAEVKTLWNQYQRGTISQNQYDYRRRLALKKYAQKIGPFEKLLFKGKTVREVARISRTKAVPATAKIDKQLHRLGRMARHAKHGGIILTAASVGVACHDIGKAKTRQKKNEIFVETVGSTIVGTIASTTLAVIFFSNPVGWGIALALGTSAAVGSWGAGKGASALYNRLGQKIDLVKITKVDNLCR